MTRFPVAGAAEGSVGVLPHADARRATATREGSKMERTFIRASVTMSVAVEHRSRQDVRGPKCLTSGVSGERSESAGRRGWAATRMRPGARGMATGVDEHGIRGRFGDAQLVLVKVAEKDE